MKVYLLVLLLKVLHISNGEEEFSRDYDSTDIKRIEDELRRLGVVPPHTEYPEKPAELPEPNVSSAAGDFEGYWTRSRFGRLIAAFEGIPYAQAPVGPLRFSVAQPYPVLSNFKAKKPGSPCIQRDKALANTQVTGDENCLFLNIYVPEKTQRSQSELLPVIFFIHGGAFVTGRGDTFQSNILLDKDVILVTMNYRMGPLGFLTTEDGVIPGNLALKDQVAALQWVHNNIGAFGGNSCLITVMGHSTGAACSEFLMVSPRTRGLINRVILMSGSTFSPRTLAPPGQMRYHVQKAAQTLDCPENNSSALLACLRDKTAEEIALVDFNFLGVYVSKTCRAVKDTVNRVTHSKSFHQVVDVATLSLSSFANISFQVAVDACVGIVVLQLVEIERIHFTGSGVNQHVLSIRDLDYNCSLYFSKIALWVSYKSRRLRIPYIPNTRTHALILSDLESALQNKVSRCLSAPQFKILTVWGKVPVNPFKPVVEGDVPGALLPRHPKDLYDSGLFNDVPLLAGITSEEGVFFTFDLFQNETLIRELDENFEKNAPEALYLNLPDGEECDEISESLRRAYFTPGPLTKSNFFQAARLFTDVYNFRPISKTALTHKNSGKSPTFFYYNSFENAQTLRTLPPDVSRKNLGLAHGDDLFYLFNISSELKPSPQDVYLSVIITDLFFGFVRDGVPSSNYLKSPWLAVNKSDGTDLNYLHIKSPLEISMGKNLFPERRVLLETLLPAN